MLQPDLILLIQEALTNEEFVFYYQPKISLLTGRVCGLEALIRWIKPDGQIIPPNQFIPVAEASGLIRDISLVMFDKLVADHAIVEEVCPGLVYSFNLTALDFEANTMVERIHRAIRSSQIDPRQLQVELTETALMQSSDHIRGHVQSVVDLGVSLAMDDFGTGYSSIDVLSQWPFSVVKLHQGIVGRVLESEKSTTIVKNSIHMAHQLGLKVVAEGIETPEIYDFLVKSGCTEAQGFWMGKPMPLDELLVFLRRDERWDGSPIGLIHMIQIDHLEWRRSLIDQVLEKAYGVPTSLGRSDGIEIEHNPRHCPLGRWYYGLGEAFRGISAFAALELPHNELHDIAQRLVAEVEWGAEQAEVVQMLRQLSQKSGEVLTLLQDIELQALLEKSQNNFVDGKAIPAGMDSIQ